MLTVHRTHTYCTGWLAALPQTMQALSRLSALSRTAKERKTAMDTVYMVCGALRVLTALVHDGPQQALVPTWRRLLNGSNTLPALCSLVASSAEKATRSRAAAGRTGALDLQLERNIHNATRELCDAVLMLDSVNLEYRQMLDHPAVEKILQVRSCFLHVSVELAPTGNHVGARGWLALCGRGEQISLASSPATRSMHVTNSSVSLT